MNERGQAFSVYKLLIGAITALLILVIIINAVNYFEGLKFDISRQRFIAGLQQAVKQPNEEVLKMDSIILKQGDVYPAVLLADIMNIGADCVALDAAAASAFDLRADSLVINSEINTAVYVQCSSSPCGSGCEICCTVSFGEEI